MCTPIVSDVNYHKFSHDTAFYAHNALCLNSENNKGPDQTEQLKKQVCTVVVVKVHCAIVVLLFYVHSKHLRSPNHAFPGQA